MQLEESLRVEVTPKNILMIGPTGVGKTEIARRLAKLANAPFIKVEATKFTEVGYVGKEVETIIRDLTDVAVKMTHQQAMEKVKSARKSKLKSAFSMHYCHQHAIAGVKSSRKKTPQTLAKSSVKNCVKVS